MKSLRLLGALLAANLALLPGAALAQKIFLNPSDQYANAVATGGNEAEFANDNARRAQAIINAAGFSTQLVEGMGAAVDAANAWGADIYISIHTNAGGGHGTETFYYPGSGAGSNLAGAVQNGLMARFNVGNRGVKSADFYVLRETSMIAALTEAIFHDCGGTVHSFPIGTMCEADFLRDANGRALIAEGIAAGACSYYGATCPASCQPTSEVCDGQDNDCDGTADNGDPGGGGACNTGRPGICAAGVNHCRGGSIACDQSNSAAAESCDGQDNDCDGTADNGDPGGGGACDTGRPGVCAAGVNHCRGGSVVCDQSASEGAEICDGQDNDCDGATDEDACQQDGGVPPDPDPDAGQTDDGGTPPVADGGQPVDGGGEQVMPVVPDTSCGCTSAGAPPLSVALFALLGLGLKRRPRR